MTNTKLVSSDLNGTLVHQHTMSDMIRLYIGREQYEQANAVFKRQTSGTASMEEAFGTAGPLTRGVTLRQAIEYTKTEMKYVDGFPAFINGLAQREIPFVINSTGYSVTIYSIKEQLGAEKIHGSIGNVLEFGMDGDSQQSLRQDELAQLVREYFYTEGASQKNEYDKIKATGDITLGLQDEEAKATLILGYVQKHFPDIQPHEIAHMGDSGGIVGIAEAGGIGIAFNYNGALQQHLQERLRNPIAGQINFVDPKSETSDLGRVLPILLI